MREALSSLPGVEKGSIKVDVASKSAKFKLADKTKLDEQAVKDAIKEVGFTVSAVKNGESK